MNPFAKETRQIPDTDVSLTLRAQQFAKRESLFDRGVIDSSTVSELVAFLEEKYPIRISDDELGTDNLSINHLVSFLERKLVDT